MPPQFAIAYTVLAGEAGDQTQHEAQLSRMRTELEASRAAERETQIKNDAMARELVSAHKKIQELATRVNQLHKLAELYKSQLAAQTGAQKPTTAAAVEAPKTANIRPMTALSAPTSTTQVRFA